MSQCAIIVQCNNAINIGGRNREEQVTALLAILHQAILVTSDRDFEKLGRHFPILWIARP